MIFLFRWFEKNQKQQAQTTRDATRIRRAINKTSKTFTESKMKTVKDLAQERYPGYDSDGGIMGRPAPLTSEGDKILSVLAR